MSAQNAHVRPEPIEAPEPRPVERQKDLVRSHALAWGWRVMTADGPALGSMASFKAGVEAYEAYRECHDRRGK